MEFLSSDDDYFLGRLLEPHQKIGSVTMIDMSCSETLLYETPRSIRRFRFDKSRLAYKQEQTRKRSSMPSVADGPAVSTTNEPDGKKTKRGGKPRGIKSRRRKSRRRKSRRRKSRRRK